MYNKQIMGKTNTAIILAGGKGERLRPLTDDRPKVMVELAGKPMLAWQIEWFKSFGVTNFVLAAGYKHEVIQEYLGSGSEFGVTVDYSIEESPLGRGGAVKKAFSSDLVKGREDVFVANGDIITRADLEKMASCHTEQKALATVLVVPYLSRWAVLRLDENNHILDFAETPRLPLWINAGVYIFNKEIENILPDIGDHEVKTFPNISSDKFVAFKYEGFWRAVDTVKDKSETEQFLEHNNQ